VVQATRECADTMGMGMIWIAIFLASVGAGCTLALDDAESLAHEIESRAAELKKSDAAEAIVEYEPPEEFEYAVRFEVSTSLQPPYTGALVVGPDWAGSGGGSGTTYHARFVYVPKPLYIKKRGTSTEIVLRKNGDRIEVVGLR
jgi:hypothetical protein